jgi:hypothetical protein
MLIWKKIDRPGKSIDGLYPLDFAKLLEAKTKAEEKRLAYREFISIIQEKIKERSASTTIESPTQ